MEKDSPLVERMRAVSKKAHSLSDALVNSKLVVAFTDPALYGRALQSFWPVFKTIEEKLSKHQDNPSIKALGDVLAVMKRTERLEADLDYFLGPGWKSEYTMPQPVKAYVAHLDSLERENPVLLLVFAYHMHMAVCAGGAIIRKTARNAMGLPRDAGTAVFEFDLGSGAPLSRLKSDYKTRINGLAETHGREFVDRALQESVMLFKLNNSVVAGFQAGFIGYIRALILLCSKPISFMILAIVSSAVAAMANIEARKHTSDVSILIAPLLLPVGVAVWYLRSLRLTRAQESTPHKE